MTKQHAHNTSSVSAPAMVMLAIVSIQVGAALAIDLFPTLGAIGTVFWRVAISALLLLVLIRPAFDRAVWDHRGLLLAYGVGLGAMNWCFYEAIARIPLGIAVTIEFMGPLTVGVLSSRRPIDLVWLAVALAGLLMLTPDVGSDLDGIGVAYAVAAGIGWGLFVILSKRVNKVLPGSSGLVFGMLISSAMLFPFAIGHLAPVFVDMRLLVSVAGLALLATTIPFYLEFAALKQLTAQTYGVLITMEPVVAAVVGALVLGEVLGVTAMIAIGCVTVAAVGATMTRER